MKPRADNKLQSMPQEWQDDLCGWLAIENCTLKEARKRLIEKYEVSTSERALSEYYSSVAAPWKYAQARGLADDFAKLSDGQFDSASLKRLQQLLFEMTVSNRVDLKAVKTIAKIVGDSHKLALAQDRLQLDKRKVKLLEAKAALADQASEIAKDKTLTEEEQGARMRALFRM